MTRLTQVFTDLVRVETRLYNTLDARVRAEHGMTVGQVEILRLVRDVENCRVLDIVQDVAITVGAVSKAVDRLEAAGWVRRSANPEDRRSSLLSLTTDGATRLAQAEPTVEAELANWFDGTATAGLGPAVAALRARLERSSAGE